MITGPPTAMWVRRLHPLPYDTWNVVVTDPVLGRLLLLGVSDDTACWCPAARANRPARRPRKYFAPLSASEFEWRPEDDACPF